LADVADHFIRPDSTQREFLRPWPRSRGATLVKRVEALSNKAMKLTSPEPIEVSQLIAGVRRTNRVEAERRNGGEEHE
jgi:hypothetical protein